jgi:hypothetical protein
VKSSNALQGAVIHGEFLYALPGNDEVDVQVEDEVVQRALTNVLGGVIDFLREVDRSAIRVLKTD